MICPVCGAQQPKMCPMTEPPFPGECLRFMKPPLLRLEALGVGIVSSNIKDAWEGPDVAAVASVIEQIGQLRGRAA